MTTSNKTMVQVYNKEIVREYYTLFPHLFWTSKELVHTEQLENTVHVKVTTDKPIKVLVNGVEYTKRLIYHTTNEDIYDNKIK